MAAPRKNTCPVCRHAERVRIEDLRAAGVSFETLAERFGIRKASLHKHWHEHTSADRKLSYLAGKTTIGQLRERAAEENLSLLDYLAITRSALMGMLIGQCEAGAAIPAATVAGRLLSILQEIGKITGEIQRADPASTTIHIGIMAAPGFADLQAGLMQIARDHPAARSDIVGLLRGLDPSPPRHPAPLLINGAAHA